MPEIDYVDHRAGARELAAAFPGLREADLPDGEGWALERMRITTHNGTHLDAPWHYASTMDNGARAITIDEVPLEWCFAPGITLDFRHLPGGHVVSAAEVVTDLARINHVLRPPDIVLYQRAKFLTHCALPLKMFFSEEKNQKTLRVLSRTSQGAPTP